MAFLRRERQIPSTSEQVASQDPTAVAAVTGGLAIRETLQSPMDIDAVVEGLQPDIERATEAWAGVRTVIDSYAPAEDLAQATIGKQLFIEARADGANIRSYRRRLGQEETEWVKLAVLTGRVSALESTGHIDEKPDSLLMGTVVQQADPSSQRLFAKAQQMASSMETVAVPAEFASSRMVTGIAEFIAQGAQNTDRFVEWVRQTAAEPKGKEALLEALARDVHDPRSKKLVEQALSARADEEAMSPHRTKFADIIENDDGGFKDAREVFDFARKFAKSAKGWDVSIRDIVVSMPPSDWPEVAQRAFQNIVTGYDKEVMEAVRTALAPYVKKYQQYPDIKEYEALQRYRISDTDRVAKEMRGKARAPEKARVPDAIIDTSNEVVPPRQNAVTSAKVVQQNGKRIIELATQTEDGSDQEEVIVEKFIADYKLDASQAQIARADIRKMITALRTKSHGTRGTTNLTEVKPYIIQGTSKTAQVWRLNPAHYTGLSVSALGKDTRLIYVQSEGTVGVLGAYRHDEYERAIADLR